MAPMRSFTRLRAARLTTAKPLVCRVGSWRLSAGPSRADRLITADRLASASYGEPFRCLAGGRRRVGVCPAKMRAEGPSELLRASQWPEPALAADPTALRSASEGAIWCRATLEIRLPGGCAAGGQAAGALGTRVVSARISSPTKTRSSIGATSERSLGQRIDAPDEPRNARSPGRATNVRARLSSARRSGRPSRGSSLWVCSKRSRGVLADSARRSHLRGHPTQAARRGPDRAKRPLTAGGRSHRLSNRSQEAPQTALTEARTHMSCRGVSCRGVSIERRSNDSDGQTAQAAATESSRSYDEFCWTNVRAATGLTAFARLL